MENKSPIHFLEIPKSDDRRVDIPELYRTIFPMWNYRISEIDNLFREKQRVDSVKVDDYSYLHQEFKNFLLTLKPWGMSCFFDELIASIGIGVVNMKNPQKALLFALNYRSKRNNLTLLEALDSTGNFRDAEKCEAILYQLPVEKPKKYTMGRAFREMVGCFSTAKTFEGRDWAGLRIELSDIAKEAILKWDINAGCEQIKGKTIAMRLAELLAHPSTSIMAANAFDILVNRFETVPDFSMRDQDGKTLYEYLGNSQYGEFARELLGSIEKTLKENQRLHFPSEDPSIEALRNAGYPFAMRVNDVLNMMYGEEDEYMYLNLLKDPKNVNSVYQENDIIPRSESSINDRV